MSLWELMGRRMKPGAARAVVGMNRRNLQLIQPKNRREDHPIANDKLRAKQVLAAAGVPVAPTIGTVDSLRELDSIGETLAPLAQFVVKPARGHGGRGILVVAGRSGEDYVTAGGRRISPSALERHIGDIVFGVYTFDRPDVAIIEPRLIPHPVFGAMYADGLSDLRVLAVDDVPRLAMARVPTIASDGRANLHQGAVGLGIDITTGVVERAWFRGRAVDRHPNSGETMLGREVPHWPDIVEMSAATARAVPLKYLGIDVVIDLGRGPLVLEINDRPGLEIQNVTGTPLMEGLA